MSNNILWSQLRLLDKIANNKNFRNLFWEFCMDPMTAFQNLWKSKLIRRQITVISWLLILLMPNFWKIFLFFDFSKHKIFRKFSEFRNYSEPFWFNLMRNIYTGDIAESTRKESVLFSLIKNTIIQWFLNFLAKVLF